MEMVEEALLKGKITERKVFLALEKLQEEGKIRAFGQTMPFSKDDLDGIDFFVYTLNDKRLELSVSTRPKPWEKQKLLRCRGIIVFNILMEVDQEAVLKEVAKIIEAAQKLSKRKRP